MAGGRHRSRRVDGLRREEAVAGGIAGAARSGAGLSMIDPDPIFIFDSREAWRRVAVEESLAAHGYVWSGDGWLRDGEPADRIALPAGLVQPADLGCAGYVRSVNAGGLVWRQYWLWWLYNPKTYAGFGAHEGDWELVQIGCADDAGERPILMTCSQHSG